MGACFGNRRREATLENLLNLAVDTDEFPSHLDDWFCNAHQRSAALSLGIQANSLYVLNVAAERDRLVSRLFVNWKQAPRHFVAAYAALVRPWTEQMLLDEFGGHAESVAWYVEGVHLGERFSQLLRWQWLAAVASPERGPQATETAELWAMRQFQGDLPALGSCLGRHLGRFEHWLRQRVL